MKKDAYSARRHIVIGVLALAVLVGGFGTWAVVSQIAGAVIASGRIEVDRNRQVVQHPDGGVVAEIEVKEGDLVEVGQTLIRLDSTSLHSELTIAESQLFELRARRGRLEAERDEAKTITFDKELMEVAATNPDVAELVDGQRRLFEARIDSVAREIEQLDKRRGQIKNQITGIGAQQKSMRRQLELIEVELTNQQSLLNRGLAQAGTVLNAPPRTSRARLANSSPPRRRPKAASPRSTSRC